MIRAILLLCLLSSAAWAGDANSAFDGDIRVLPDITMSPAALNPDVVRSGITIADLCPHANTKAIRNVPKSVADAVYAEYGLVRFQGECAAPDPKTGKPAGCEVDHICSLELGCSNDIKNLWVQPYSGTVFNAHLKDSLENKLHAMACAGSISLTEAQQAISTDWIAAYRKYIGDPDQ